MAKQIEDKTTVEMFEMKRGRGRPSTGCAMSAAERQAKYRAKKLGESRRKARDLADDVSIYEDLDVETLAYYAASEQLDENMRRRAWMALGKKMGWM